MSATVSIVIMDADFIVIRNIMGPSFGPASDLVHNSNWRMSHLVILKQNANNKDEVKHAKHGKRLQPLPLRFQRVGNHWTKKEKQIRGDEHSS